jgi:hypothetical protein
MFSAASAAAQTQPAGSGTSQLRIETIESGFAGGSDVRFTEINDRSATLAGVYGGWVTDRTLFIGGGGYWLANRDDDFKLAYGGPMVGVIIRGDHRLSFGARTLIGFGNTTLSYTAVGLAGEGIRFGAARSRGRRGFPTVPSRVVFEDDFFIAEPQIDATWRVTNWLRVGGGVGYRLVGSSDLADDRVDGLSGSVIVQFGK